MAMTSSYDTKRQTDGYDWFVYDDEEGAVTGELQKSLGIFRPSIPPGRRRLIIKGMIVMAVVAIAVGVFLGGISKTKEEEVAAKDVNIFIADGDDDTTFTEGSNNDNIFNGNSSGDKSSSPRPSSANSNASVTGAPSQRLTDAPTPTTTATMVSTNKPTTVILSTSPSGPATTATNSNATPTSSTLDPTVVLSVSPTLDPAVVLTT